MSGAILAAPSQPPSPGSQEGYDVPGHQSLKGSSCSLWWPHSAGQLPGPKPTAFLASLKLTP